MGYLTKAETALMLSKIKPAHPDQNLCIRFPGWKYHEENRYARIRYEEYNHYKDGWLPCGDNWWRFPMTDEWVEIGKKNHKTMNASLRAQGFNIYDTEEPE